VDRDRASGSGVVVGDCNHQHSSDYNQSEAGSYCDLSLGLNCELHL
jgi:hypothetical protein